MLPTVDSAPSTTLPFIQRFDAFLRIQTRHENGSGPAKKKRPRLENGGKILPDGSSFMDILEKGFGDRVLALEEGKSNKRRLGSSEVIMGVRLNQATYQRMIDRGPLADSAEANSFRHLWGEKSEMRKFADGAICEAVLWPANNMMERRRILEQIAQFLLERHFSIPSEYVRMTQHTIELALLPSPTSSWCGITNTGEEQFRTLCESYEKLSSILRSVEGLPLTLTGVQPVSASLRHTEVLPYPVQPPVNGKASVYVRGECLVPRPSGLFAPPWNQSYEVQIVFEASSKWPEDVKAIRKLKCAFYLKLRELLRDQFALTSWSYEDRLLVKLGPFIFRVVVVYPREVTLLKMKKNERGLVLSRNTKESLAAEMATVHAPKHAARILGMVHLYTSFPLTCRLARRWICCHMLSDFLRHEAVELLVASVYLDNGPAGSPGWTFSGFIRFLRLLVTHDWLSSPIIVNFNNELPDDQLTQVQSKFVSLRPTLPPMCIVTPDDQLGNRWTHPYPSAMIMERLCNLAKASLDVLESSASRLSSSIVQTIFQPSLDIYDVLIRLRWKRVPKRFMAFATGGETSLKREEGAQKDKEGAEQATASPRRGRSDPRKDRNKSQNNTGSFPVVDFDPVAEFVNALRMKYDRLAMFFYDSCGGDVIGVLIRPKVLETKEDVSEDKKIQLMANITEMVQNFSSLGKGIVKEVTTLRLLEV